MCDKKGNIVRLKDDEGNVVGSGVLYYEENLGENIYVLTAAHCLHKDCDKFSDLRNDISIDVYSYKNSRYEQITINNLSEHCVYSPSKDIDLAVIVINKIDVDAINSNLSSIEIVNSPANVKKMQLYGFPKANEHIEVLPNNLEIIDERIGEQQFFLSMEQNIEPFFLTGYSGGAIFINTPTNENILIGLFVRVQKDEERGSIGYGQYLKGLNILLEERRLPKISFGYFGIDGLTHKKISSLCAKSKSNLTPDYGIQVKSTIEPYLDAICRNDNFYNRYRESFDKWFQGLFVYSNNRNSKVVLLENEFIELKDELSEIINVYDLNVPNKIDFSRCKTLIKRFKEKLGTNIKELNKQLSILDKRSNNQEQEELSNAISRLYTLKNYCEEFYDSIDETYYNYANTSIAIIEGEAGCGKSFILGNLSKSIIDNKMPVVLLLGRDFNKNESIEWNIKKLIDIDYDFESFISNCNSIAIEKKQRFMFLIDAINETKGRHYWRNNLCGLVDLIKKYPAVGLILSVRSTYYKDVIPKELNNDESIKIIHHNGLKGNEDEAIRVFCDYYKIASPNLPLLNPEYSNPLMLHISCKVTKEKGGGKFIIAHTCISSLFSAYRKMYDQMLGDSKEIYENRRVVSKSIYCIAKRMFEIGSDSINYDSCDELLLKSVGAYPNLLNDLILSGILSKEVIYGNEEEFVRFTYQRLADYYIAETLVKGCETSDIINMFANSSIKETLFGHTNISGIIEHLAILLPERFNIELWEVLNLSEIQYFYKTNSEILFESLAWRSKESVNLEKIRKLLETEDFDYYEYLNTLVLLAPIPSHPLNSDYWHSIMKKYDLPHREEFLQQFLLDYSNIDNRFSFSYINRLVEWSWKKGISDEVDNEVARLIGQILAWFLSSTLNSLRDKTTKAMVNILQSHTSALLSILKSFEDIDDPYIQERLYAVAYACVLRTKNLNDKKLIGEYVYNHVFVNLNIPRHILTRDYMCNIVDYAVKMAGLDGVDMIKVLPPYNEPMPIFPTREEIDKYKIPYKSEVRFKYAQNCIIHSLVDGQADFGDKIVDSRVRDFFAWSFRIREEYDDFKKDINKEQKEILECYEQIIRFIEDPVNDLFAELSISEEYKKLKQEITEQLPQLIEDLNCCFDRDVADRIRKLYVPNHLKYGKNIYSSRIDTLGIKYWIVKRVFELGYNKDLHGKYDEYVKRIDDFGYYKIGDGKAERIGKKYEWIAFYEILGCIADNHYISNPDTLEPEMYRGAWQTYVRDIDPVCITKRNEEPIKSSWYEYNINPYWNQEINSWFETNLEVSEIKSILQREDNNGSKWLTLYDYNTLYEPTKIGHQSWNVNSRHFNICIQSYIINKNDKNKLIKETLGKNFIELNMLDSPRTALYYISREKYWSGAYSNDTKNNIKDLMKPLYKRSRIKGMYTLESLNGGIHENSGIQTQYNMPVECLLRMLNATYAEEDGFFINDNGEIVVCCNPSSQRIGHTLSHKDRLLTALNSNGLDLVWFVNIEKSYSSRVNGKIVHRGTISCGLFYLDENSNINGTLTLHKEE